MAYRRASLTAHPWLPPIRQLPQKIGHLRAIDLPVRLQLRLTDRNSFVDGIGNSGPQAPGDK